MTAPAPLASPTLFAPRDPFDLPVARSSLASVRLTPVGGAGTTDHASPPLASPVGVPGPRVASRRLPRPSGIGLVGLGAFGRFAAPYLARIAPVRAHDPAFGMDGVDGPDRLGSGIEVGDLADAARQPVVVLAVPLPALKAVAEAIRPHLVPGAVVVDVSSVKIEPLAILRARLPETVTVVGTHPLFGPVSGRDGIAGARIAVCGGRRARLVAAVAATSLGLEPIAISAEEHDREMAYVQGLTHVVARAFAALDAPAVRCRTATYDLLHRMAELVGSDSDQLFRTIVAANPFAGGVVARYARRIGDLAEAPREANDVVLDRLS